MCTRIGETYRVAEFAAPSGLTTGPVPDPRYAGWLAHALDLARASGQLGEVPVGAVIVDGAGEIIGTGANAREATGDPTAHAEIVALRAAARHTGSWRLADCTLVVTLEPCVMCAGAIVQARVRTVVIGAWDDKAGACGSVWDLVRDRRANHWVEVVGALDEAGCGGVLREFFEARR
ncbi:MAG: nucleoside deaminase [Dermatophilaceae bacterium]|jgi:tRNA(adenine34) deaminase|nr:nucleoside deaminase [Actinomycetales bacterium]MBP8881121.1 nucleoside deaminase [Dermatophilaceae bacterium]MBP9917257.1 nucleoside deaminase [Dermatophilaceae bacterium]